MHLTCTNMPRESLKAALDRVKAEGIQNILTLRGDPPKGAASFEAVEGGFSCALDLVTYIREEYGSQFGLTVAGYPEAHPDVIKADPEEQKAAYASDLAYLKRKVDAGGEVVITQLFYDVELFLKFVADCRAIGITVPIVPGVMPIQTYGGFVRMTGFCKTFVPPSVASVLDGIKDNEDACRAYGIQLAVDMCRRMLDSGTPGVHLYSLNSDRAVTPILERLGLIPAGSPRPLAPWRQPVSVKGRRAEEAARPLYWDATPRSYLARTAHWPAPLLHADQLGLPAPFAPHVARAKSERARAARAAALAPAPLASAADVGASFGRYLTGAAAGAWPWAESGAPGARLVAAVSAARQPLTALLDAGVLVIDAALPLHGALTEEAVWGSPGGRLYQKSFLLAFAPAPLAAALAAAAARAPGGGSALTATAGGVVQLTGSAPAPSGRPSPTAWAVWPGAPIAVPSVSSADAFAAWAPEAFDAFDSDWAALYEAAGDAASAATLRKLASTHVALFVCAEDTALEGGALFALLAAAAATVAA